MKESWSQIREILVKSPDINEDEETVWQGSLLELICKQENYEVLKSWQSLLINLANVDPNYWDWEEYWIHCKENTSKKYLKLSMID
ncbi:hypothetical protein GvMRE_I1g381 [endosymbiont GvMRE of Glomus versiforme]|nr:hypothetical protein GvMRE_I1g381 [endosymbiont GvMRE of Glomus versiforme]